MQLVQTSDAIGLTGLTAHQLREWCGRRRIVAPDVPASGRGRHAMYSWQTILALRLLKVLHERFGSEVGAWSQAITNVQAELRQASFPSLWGTSVVFLNTRDVLLVKSNVDSSARSYLLLELDPHLQELASGLAMPGPPDQLPLFTVLKVGR